MTVDIPKECAVILEDAVVSGAFASAEHALRHALGLLAKEQNLLSDADFRAIQVGISEAEAGLGRPVAEFDAELRGQNRFTKKKSP